MAVSTLVLLLASGAWAAIGQTEGFSIGGTNYASLIGSGLVQSSNYGTVGQIQEAANSTNTLFTAQKEDGTLTQAASIVGRAGCSYGCCQGSDTTVRQEGEGWGSQGQFAGTSSFGSIGMAAQELGVDLGTHAVTEKGNGTTASQSFVGSQDQITVTPVGVSIQGQAVEANQLVDIGESRYSHADISNGLNVQSSQSQIVVGH